MAGMVAMWNADTHQALVEEIELFAGTPALRIFGVVSGVSVGSAFMTRGYLLLAVLAALMSALAVVRHTRQNEETGRAEMVGAAVVGRHAGLAAALIVTVGANIVLAGLLGLAGIVNGLPATGSFMAGLAVGAIGIVFAGIAAVTVQLSSTTRGASGLAAAVLALSFLVSGLGNMLGSVDASGVRVVSAWPVWLSPDRLGVSRCARSAATSGGRSACSPSHLLRSWPRQACSQPGATSGAASSPIDVDTLRPRPSSSAPSGSPGACSAVPCSDGQSAWPDSV